MPFARPSYSSTVATVALFLALGGGSYAAAKTVAAKPSTVKLCARSGGAVTVAQAGKACKRGTHTYVLDQHGALKTVAGAGGVAGAAGPAGPTGPAGPQGPQGEKGATGPSTGKAGGDLAGNYPNPTLAPAAVKTAALVDAAVTSDKLAPEAVTAATIKAGAVGAKSLGQIVTVTENFSGQGNNELIHGPDSTNTLTATCPAGTRVISGGFQSGYIGGFAPSATYMTSTGWATQGRLVGTGPVTVSVKANCLQLGS